MTTLPPLSKTLSGRHLVVTGFTGFVGKVWVAMLLEAVPDVSRLTLLVRPQRRLSARQRVAKIIDTSPVFRTFRRRAGANLADWVDRVIDVVEADLGQPNGGLSPETWTDLAASADMVVHLAGLTDFHPDPAKCLVANIQATGHMADLAAALKTPRLAHVSTCYVAGTKTEGLVEARPGPLSPAGQPLDAAQEIAWLTELCATESDANERTRIGGDRAASLGWPNLYTYSKALAEHLLVARTDIELTIIRPSVVECATRFPMPGWNEGLNTSAPVMWYATTGFRALPSRADHTFDVIPVDAVCRRLTVICAAHLRGEADAVYQLASGDCNPVTFDRIAELTSVAVRRDARRGGHLSQHLLALQDTVPRPRDALGIATTGTALDLAERADTWLAENAPSTRLPAALAAVVQPTWKRWRKRVKRTARDVQRLHDMLDLYRPFLHDHNWTYQTTQTRALMTRLHEDDLEFWSDDLPTMCWRTYWTEVQYPGIQTWAFPIMEGRRAPTDPPSQPPLELQGHRVRQRRQQGAA
ncbi:MAG: SDR family oxidoreductase [Myxococcota bacterium]